MKQIVECVPNFSEGRRQEVIDAIADAIRNTEGCSLLDVDAGYSTNRTVYTFVGDPHSVCEGALAAAAIAKDLIDMSKHHGEHPRFGAMDVCPFIPVAGISMDECAELAETFAKIAGEELGLPMYLYEESAKAEYRRKLPDVRGQEYEGLEQRMQDPRWKPDYGPDNFVPSWGATATGARMFLIAYNVNILATPNQAHRIALNLREAGRGPKKPGRLKEVKGLGWFVDEYNMAQVSVNLNNYTITSIHLLFEEVKKEAKALGVAVAGSEIVGLIPLEALLMAADYYIETEELFIYQQDQKIRLAIERLGLNSVSPFNPQEKIIDYIVTEEPELPLASLSVKDFITEVAARTSAPGGGSVSAATAAMGVGLGAMVAKLTYGVRKFENVQTHMQNIIPTLDGISKKLIPMIDADTNAFNDFIEGVRLPKSTDDEQKIRHQKMQDGLKKATNIPIEVMRLADGAWDGFITVAKYGNLASGSDILVGAKALETGVWGAYQNVLINLKDIEDKEFCKNIKNEAQSLTDRSNEFTFKITEILEKR